MIAERDGWPGWVPPVGGPSTSRDVPVALDPLHTAPRILYSMRQVLTSPSIGPSYCGPVSNSLPGRSLTTVYSNTVPHQYLLMRLSIRCTLAGPCFEPHQYLLLRCRSAVLSRGCASNIMLYPGRTKSMRALAAVPARRLAGPVRSDSTDRSVLSHTVERDLDCPDNPWRSFSQKPESHRIWAFPSPGFPMSIADRWAASGAVVHNAVESHRPELLHPAVHSFRSRKTTTSQPMCIAAMVSQTLVAWTVGRKQVPHSCISTA